MRTLQSDVQSSSIKSLAKASWRSFPGIPEKRFICTIWRWFQRFLTEAGSVLPPSDGSDTASFV